MKLETVTAWMYHFEGHDEPDLTTLAFTESDAYAKAINKVADPSYFWTGPYGKTVAVTLTITPNNKVKGSHNRAKADDYKPL